MEQDEHARIDHEYLHKPLQDTSPAGRLTPPLESPASKNTENISSVMNQRLESESKDVEERVACCLITIAGKIHEPCRITVLRRLL